MVGIFGNILAFFSAIVYIWSGASKLECLSDPQGMSALFSSQSHFNLITSANTVKFAYNCKIFSLGSSKYNLLTCFKLRLFSYWHTLLYSRSDWTRSFLSYSWKMISIFTILSENLDLHCWRFSFLERGPCAYKRAFVLEIAVLLPMPSLFGFFFFFSYQYPVAPPSESHWHGHFLLEGFLPHIYFLRELTLRLKEMLIFCLIFWSSLPGLDHSLE